MAFTGRIRYDRRVSEEFLANFLAGGFARSLVEYASKARFPVDLQMRHSPKTGADHASVYVGLTSVLNVEAKPKSKFVLKAHPTWSDGAFGFDPAWSQPAGAEEWPKHWLSVEEYLEKVIPAAG